MGLFGLILFAWTLPALSSSLSMESSLGFNGYFQINKWTPLVVTVENRGKAISGKLEVLVTSGSEYHGNVYQAKYSLDLDVPYGSRKRCYFTVLIESVTHNLIIRFQQDDETLAAQSINLRTLYTQKDLAGILIDSIYPEIIPAFPKSLLPVHLQEKYLPETWYGYDGVKILVMEAGKVNRLGERQLEALDQWIRQGGFFVMTGSINAGTLMNRGIQRLLPLKVFGLKKFNQLQSFFGFSEYRMVNPNPFLVLHVDVKGSDILVEEDNIPLILEHGLGDGSIVFLSFDPHSPPFIRLMSESGFWKKILMLPSKNGSKPIMLPNQRIMQVMLASVNVKFPRFWLSGLSIVLYLTLFWICVKRMRNHRWRYVRYIFFTIIFFSFTGIGYSLFFSQKGASYNSFCHLNLNEKKANAAGEYFLGLYSIGEEPYDLSFIEPPMPVTHLISENSTSKIPSPYTTKQVGRYNHLIGLSENWSYSFYVAHPRFEFPLRVDAMADEEHLNLVIHNQTPYEITDCLIYYNQRFYKMKDISSDSKESRRIAKSTIELEKPYDMEKPKSFNIKRGVREAKLLDTIKNSLKDDLWSAIHAMAGTDKNTIYVMGWIQSDIMRPNFAQKDISGEGVTLISWQGRI